METAGGLPGTAEVLRESGRTRVTRVFLPGRTIVRKQPLGPDAERRLRQERAVLERLLGIPGVVQPVDEPRYPGAISLVDLGGPSLATVPAPLDAEAVVRIGSALAGALAGMHRRGVLHRDITPANVVLSRDGTPCLVGFGRATPLAEIRPEFTHHTEIVGTLAYLAPEQTGRTGRSVDQRADLYALGATLYELATGAPPFGSGDPLRLSHDHLARIPVPPAEVNPTVPEPLSEIILHLWRRSRTTATRARTACSTTSSGCGTAGRARRQLRCPSGGGTSRCGCCRRPGSSAATRRWPRWRRRSTTRLPAGAGRCSSAARPGWARPR